MHSEEVVSTDRRRARYFAFQPSRTSSGWTVWWDLREIMTDHQLVDFAFVRVPALHDLQSQPSPPIVVKCLRSDGSEGTPARAVDALYLRSGGLDGMDGRMGMIVVAATARVPARPSPVQLSASRRYNERRTRGWRRGVRTDKRHR